MTDHNGSLPLRIDPTEVDAQRAKGWPDWHPERFCERCGSRNIWSWSVDSDRFNAAMAAIGLDSGAIVCPSCFASAHEKATGMRCTWRLVPDTPFHHIDDEGER